MLSLGLFTVVVLQAVLGLARPSISTPTVEASYTKRDDACTTPSQLKPWTNLTSTEKLDYINADLCLMSSPPKNGLPGAQNRWDELQYVHITQSSYIHGVGAFLPFHRYFVTVHARLLRDECGYNGPTPYWDEPVDLGNIGGSALWDTELGFGGNGSSSEDQCITDGPFANVTLHFNMDLTTTEVCITRRLNDRAFSSAARENVEKCLAQDGFEEAWNCLEGGPHGAGHGGVSGTMVNPLLSPGDPVFYLHHAYLDKLFWDWQSLDLPARLTRVGGRNVGGGFGKFPGFNGTGPNPFDGGGDNSTGFFPPPGNFSGFPFPGPAEEQPLNHALVDYFNDGGNTTTLNHTLWSGGIMKNVTIGDVMDIHSAFVCTEYL
ncbi:Di-copper centre-containing protein [Xylariaceae sp. FL0662B]|nr:Di-copper centre-containing protein [Xylariaceae sp. FL0662B]